MIVIILKAMGHSREDKRASHERIVEIASERIRSEGIAQPGVAEIMRAAGLTHGGFYKHFDSRDDLIAEAADRALRGNEETVAALLSDTDDPIATFADWYVSTAHRDNPAHGCGVVALGGDAARAGDRVQAAYRAQVERYLATLERLLGGDEDARRRATVTLSALVGAVVLARALGDTPQSDDLLRNVRDAVRTGRLVA